MQQRHETPSALSQSLRRCRSAIFGVALISAVINCLFLTGPLFMLEVYDRVLPSRSIATLLSLLTIIAVLYSCQGLLDLLRNRILSRAGAHMDRAVSAAVFSSVITEAVRHPNEEQNLQPMRDIDHIRAFFGSPGPGALFDLPWLPFYMLICFSFHWWIGMTALCGALILLLLTLMTDLSSRAPSAAASRHFAARAAIANTSRLNAEVVSVLGMRTRLSARWQDSNNSFVGTQLRLADIGLVFSTLSRTFRMFLQSGVLALGAFLFIRGEVTAGMIVACGILVSRALAPVELSIANWRNFVAARQSWKRLQATLDRSVGRPPLPLPCPMKSLDVEGLAVAAPGRELPVLVHADFSLKAGTALAVIGPSAGGKSSLARTLVGLWKPASGTVRIDGARLDHWDGEALASHIGYLPQSVELFAGTVAQNISRFDSSATSEQVIAAARDADVHDMILRLPGGYDTQVGEGGSILSTGQRQRIGLARALFGNPFLVVLDEPNSNLDQNGEAALAAAIGKISARGGITVVVAHRASVLRVCDQVLLVAEGRTRMLDHDRRRIGMMGPLATSARLDSGSPIKDGLGADTAPASLTPSPAKVRPAIEVAP